MSSLLSGSSIFLLCHSITVRIFAPDFFLAGMGVMVPLFPHYVPLPPVDLLSLRTSCPPEVIQFAHSATDFSSSMSEVPPLQVGKGRATIPFFPIGFFSRQGCSGHFFLYEAPSPCHRVFPQAAGIRPFCIMANVEALLLFLSAVFFFCRQTSFSFPRLGFPICERGLCYGSATHFPFPLRSSPSLVYLVSYALVLFFFDVAHFFARALP